MKLPPILAVAALFLSGCGSLPQLGIATPTPAMSSSPPTNVRCIMSESDRTTLVVVKSTPAILEQQALDGVCKPDGRMGPTWSPLPIDTSMADYTLICEGGLAQTQLSLSVWAMKSDPTAPGRAYNGCHALANVQYSVAP